MHFIIIIEIFERGGGRVDRIRLQNNHGGRNRRSSNQVHIKGPNCGTADVEAPGKNILNT